MVHRLKHIKKSTWIRLGVGIVLVVGLVIGFFLSPLRDLLTIDALIATVEQARRNPWSSVVFYCLFIAAVLFLPVTIFPVAGGVMFGFWVAFPLNLLACTIGSYIAFEITRFFGREAVEKLLEGRLKMIDRIAGFEGIKTVLVVRLLGIPPFLIANYAMGLSAIKPRHYIIGTLLGMAPWMALVTFASHMLWEAILMGGRKGFGLALLRVMGPLSLLSLAIALTMGLGYLVRKRRHAQRHHSNL